MLRGIFFLGRHQDNRLIRVSMSNAVVGEYAYDAFGRRVKKAASGMTTLYHYDSSGKLIAETDGNGNPQRDYIYLNGEPVALKLYGTQAGMFWFINDHLGTPQKIVNNSGQVVWAAAYLPFGKAQITTETVANNLRFPGQYSDAESGLHYNWNRYYDPETGRYITADPIGLKGGVNLYSYVLNNPLIFSDITGLILVWDSPETTEAVEKLKKKSPAASDIIDKLQKKPEKVTIFTVEQEQKISPDCFPKNHHHDGRHWAIFDPKYWGDDWMRRPPEIGLVHELLHELLNLEGIPNNDPEVFKIENVIRGDYGIPLRDSYNQPGGSFGGPIGR